jgi:hypothetical protein
MTTVLPQRVRLVDPQTGLIEREWLAKLNAIATGTTSPGVPTAPGVGLTPRVVALESLAGAQSTRIAAVEASDTSQVARLVALESAALGYQS